MEIIANEYGSMDVFVAFASPLRIAEMFLARWSSYAENGHGGSVELKDLVYKKGFDYIKENFQYSILENYNARVDDHVILERESWWCVWI